MFVLGGSKLLFSLGGALKRRDAVDFPDGSEL